MSDMEISPLPPHEEVDKDHQMDIQESTTEQEGQGGVTQAKKKKIRAYHQIHAHRNPLSDSSTLIYPMNPQSMDWSKYFPKVWKDYQDAKKSNPQLLPPEVTMADIGCGYGGLSIALSRLYPTRLVLGMEIRTRVVQYVEQRLGELHGLKYETPEEVPLTGGPHPIIEIPHPDLSPFSIGPSSPSSSSHPTFAPHSFPLYHNVGVIETNAMKFLPNFFRKGQLEKMFFLFPDPHFKKTKYRLRIINSTLLSEYAYSLKIGGIIYIATDVLDLFTWMMSHLQSHPLFEQIPQAEADKDPCVPLICGSTEESRKVRKQNGSIYHALFRRVAYSGQSYEKEEQDD